MYINDAPKLAAQKPTKQMAEGELARKLAIMQDHANDLETKVESIKLAVEIEPNRDRMYRAERLLVNAKTLLTQSGMFAQHAMEALKIGDTASAWVAYRSADKALVTANVMKDRARATLQRDVLF
jgi:hypothetical protein